MSGGIYEAMDTLISTDDARALILARATPTREVACPLADALGRTLSQPLTSRDAIPPFANSAMDGFAVRMADVAAVPVDLEVVAEVAAGEQGTEVVAAGTCARIMTGAPIPENAEAVVPVEWTEGAGTNRVRILRAPSPGQYVRPRGQDVAAGETVVAAGLVVTPPVLGIAATLGWAEVPVRVPPRVAIISTGDELVDIGADLGPGQIRDSNGPALAAQASHAGADILAVRRAGDTKSAIREAVEQVLGADVLLFSGGVSVGDYDFVKEVLDAMGTQWAFWKVRQRPGKPLAFGQMDGRLVFGLPGNPVSSAMCFEQYVRPALAAMLGRTTVRPPRYRARLAETVTKASGLHHFVRGIAEPDEEGRLEVRTTGAQASNLYTSVVKANCIIHLPEALVDPAEGTAVEIEWLPW